MRYERPSNSTGNIRGKENQTSTDLSRDLFGSKLLANGRAVQLDETCLDSSSTSNIFLPMNLFTEKKVFSGFTTACLFAICPTRRSPFFVNATTDGVVRCPSAFVTMVGFPLPWRPPPSSSSRDPPPPFPLPPLPDLRAPTLELASERRLPKKTDLEEDILEALRDGEMAAAGEEPRA
ncbi:unnamed protein product [Spirodela intermedia]|uniref:Uncharacterized protein n=1 Tax=Spirodela intermedia TaxID=51605 RepID=A0A7I8IHA9_SPIIN|nr:unnamed protein product [Spirodela intermedia]CAA6657261.1 unnamed protein product [Spirodela intermedia]